MSIACIQLCSTDNVQKNLTTVERLVADSVAQGARLVVLPENFAFMGHSMEHQLEHAEEYGGGHIQEAMTELARRHKVWIVAGTMPIRTGDKVFASCMVYNDLGEVVACYNKMHLFDVDLPGQKESYRESSVFEAGDKVVVLDSPVGRLGLSVCYDMRFPELFREQLEQGVEILVVSAAFTQKTGKAHWHTLLRSRAIENLCYVVAAAQTGTHVSGRQTYGHSLLYSPWGELLAEQPEGEGCAIARLDLQKQASIRQQFPVLQHRRM